MKAPLRIPFHGIALHPIVKTEAKTIESANKALSDETISSISLAGGQIFTQFYSRRRRRLYVHTAKLVAEPRCYLHWIEIS